MDSKPTIDRMTVLVTQAFGDSIPSGPNSIGPRELVEAYWRIEDDARRKMVLCVVRWLAQMEVSDSGVNADS